MNLEEEITFNDLVDGLKADRLVETWSGDPWELIGLLFEMVLKLSESMVEAIEETGDLDLEMPELAPLLLLSSWKKVHLLVVKFSPRVAEMLGEVLKEGGQFETD